MADDWRYEQGPSNAEKMKKGFQDALNKSKRDFERTQNRLGIYGPFCLNSKTGRPDERSVDPGKRIEKSKSYAIYIKYYRKIFGDPKPQLDLNKGRDPQSVTRVRRTRGDPAEP